MADQVQYQYEIRLPVFLRVFHIVVMWVYAGCAEALILLGINALIRDKPSNAFFLGCSLVLAIICIGWSWWLTDRRLYLAVAHTATGATVYIKRIAHNKICAALRFDDLQNVSGGNMELGGERLTVLKGTAADGKQVVLVNGRDGPTHDFVIDTEVVDNLAATVNAREDDRWKTLPNQTALMDLDATSGIAHGAGAK